MDVVEIFFDNEKCLVIKLFLTDLKLGIYARESVQAQFLRD